MWLRVWPNGYGSCARPWARVSVTGGSHASRQAAGCTALRVRLPEPVAAGAGGSVSLRLRVKVPRNADRFGRVGRTVYLGNALPLLDVEDSSGPSLEPYTNLGDPFYSETAGWNVTLDVPGSLVAATTGSVTGRRWVGHGVRRLTVAAEGARDFGIVLGRFSVDSTVTSGGVRLFRYRVRGARRSAAATTLGVASGAVELFSAWYGDPGESEIDLVPPPMPGSGMEYPGLVLASDYPTLIAHELAHQWWYSLVGNDQWRSPWLDESLAEYSARRLPARVVGRDDLRCRHDHPVSGPLSAPMSHWDAAGGDRYYSTVYLGGACALRSLEADIGVEAMTAFLRSYADAHRFGIVTAEDFVAALRAAAPPGYDVDAFLRRARIEAG